MGNNCVKCGHEDFVHHNQCIQCNPRNGIIKCKQFIPNHTQTGTYTPVTEKERSASEDKDPDDNLMQVRFAEGHDSGSAFILSDMIQYFTPTTKILRSRNYIDSEDVAEFIRLLKEEFNPEGKKRYYKLNLWSARDFIEAINKLAGRRLTEGERSGS